jgi:hypothetical protein
MPAKYDFDIFTDMLADRAMARKKRIVAKKLNA